MKEFFEAIEFLFVDILFFPFDFIRLDITNWFIQNAINFSFIFLISAALVYWTLELLKYDKKEGKETDKDGPWTFNAKIASPTEETRR